MKCLILLLLMVNIVFAKKYERCELAKELHQKHYFALEDVGMLVCIAEETNLETTTLDSLIYGMFQVCFHFIDNNSII